MADRPTQLDLLLAILSLDAYMRGPEEKAAIRDLGNTVGEWQADKVASTELRGSSASGFEAVSYTSGNQTIISYRGTDFDFSSKEGFLEFLKDISSGWLSSFNVFGDSFEFAGQELYKFQPAWADEFYKVVTGKEADEGGAENVTLTGHSLGGGLAGFVDGHQPKVPRTQQVH
jgi:hypothetical protein